MSKGYARPVLVLVAAITVLSSAAISWEASSVAVNVAQVESVVPALRFASPVIGAASDFVMLVGDQSAGN
jgi:hypothetical protein